MQKPVERVVRVGGACTLPVVMVVVVFVEGADEEGPNTGLGEERGGFGVESCFLLLVLGLLGGCRRSSCWKDG